jgi:hypothetical protein
MTNGKNLSPLILFSWLLLPYYKYVLLFYAFLRLSEKHKVFVLSKNALVSYMLYICLIFYFYCKEVFYGGDSQYFMKSLIWSSLFLVFIFTPKIYRFQSSFICLVCTGVLSFLTYINAFSSSFLFEVSLDNTGFVSFHAREQLSALSHAIFFSFSCLLFEKNKNTLSYFIILPFSIPCFLLYGSFLAFYTIVAVFLWFLLANFKKKFSILAVFGLAVTFGDLSKDLYFEKFKIEENSVTRTQASRLFLDKSIHFEKILFENSRIFLLVQAFKKVPNHPFGTTWSEWIRNSEMGSPHSLLGEIIAYGGIIGIIFITSIIGVNLQRFLVLGLNYKILIFCLIFLSFLNSNNLQFPFFATLLAVLYAKA